MIFTVYIILIYEYVNILTKSNPHTHTYIYMCICTKGTLFKFILCIYNIN